LKLFAIFAILLILNIFSKPSVNYLANLVTKLLIFALRVDKEWGAQKDESESPERNHK